MKAIPIAIHTVSKQTPEEHFLSASRLQEYIQAEEVLKKAQEHAEHEEERAKGIIEEAQIKAQHIISQAQAEGKNLALRMQTQTQQEITRETLTWLVEEEELEQKIIKRLTQKIRSEMSHAFISVIDEVDQSALLMQRITSELQKLEEKQPYLLRIAPDKMEEIETALHTYQLAERLQVVADDTLKNDAVILETPFFLLKIDIKQQIQEIARYLKLGQEYRSA